MTVYQARRRRTARHRANPPSRWRSITNLLKAMRVR